MASLSLGFGKNSDKNLEDLENFYIEKRYCTICNIEQPIRSKHCKECKRCVAMYDHHCPWMGSSNPLFNDCQLFIFDRNLHRGKKPFAFHGFPVFPNYRNRLGN